MTKIGMMRPSERYFLCIAAILVFLILSTAGRASADSGPLQTTNRLPLHLLFLKPRPVRPQLPSRGDLEIAVAMEYSNTYFDHQNSRWNVLMDMEMLVTEISLVYGLTSKLALRIDLPFISMGGGFMDGFLENYHDAIGTSNYDREKRPKNTFAYRATKDGLLWLQTGETTMRLADITVSSQIELIKARGGHDMTGSLLLSLKLPTGDSTNGLGSGQFDAGFYLPLKLSANQWTLFLMPGAALNSDPDTGGADVSARNSYSFFAGVAYDFSPRTSWLVQLNYYTSPIEKTGLDALDKGALDWPSGFTAGWPMNGCWSSLFARILPWHCRILICGWVCIGHGRRERAGGEDRRKNNFTFMHLQEQSPMTA